MKAFTFFLLLTLPAVLFGQDSLKTDEVPDNVVSAFERKNRNIDNPAWLEKVTQEKPIKKVQYIAVFKDKRNNQIKKYYEENGGLIKMVKNITEDDLRESILNYIDENYDDYEIQEIYYVEKGRRNRYYSIIMHHEDPDNPPDTEVRFSHLGDFKSISNRYITEDMAKKYKNALKKDEVPDDVMESFKRRNRNAGQTIWLKKEGKYVVSFENRKGEKIEKYYNKKGEQIKTKQQLSIDELRSNMLEYIDENYDKYEPYEAYYIEKGRRNKYYNIYMHHKRADDPPKTQIQFDQSGDFITIYNMYIPEKEDEEENKIDPDFKAQVNKDTDELSDDIIEQEVKRKELPTLALKYINKNYPYPFCFQIAKLKNSDKGPIYVIKMQRRGDDYFYRLKFHHDGKLISDEKINEED